MEIVVRLRRLLLVSTLDIATLVFGRRRRRRWAHCLLRADDNLEVYHGGKMLMYAGVCRVWKSKSDPPHEILIPQFCLPSLVTSQRPRTNALIKMHDGIENGVDGDDGTLGNHVLVGRFLSAYRRGQRKKGRALRAGRQVASVTSERSKLVRWLKAEKERRRRSPASPLHETSPLLVDHHSTCILFISLSSKRDCSPLHSPTRLPLLCTAHSVLLNPL